MHASKLYTDSILPTFTHHHHNHHHHHHNHHHSARLPLRTQVATPDATYFMYAETEKEKDEWIGAIGRAIVKFSNAYTNEDGMDEGDSDMDSD